VNTKEILLKSVLTFSTLLVFITELTSAFYILNFYTISIFWFSISIVNILFIYINKDKFYKFSKTIKNQVHEIYHEFNSYEKYLMYSIFFILSLILIQGLIYPPNNYDSMTYHLARIPNWISHQSVEHYSTHIIRQIYQPPFSSFIILNINILNVGDYFDNSVQFFFLLFSLFAIISIIDLLGLNRRYKLLAVVLSVTIPEVVLQASSTQNDIIVSFFILTSVYFAAKCIKKNKFQYFIFFGLSIGLGALTKATAYIYFAPILVFFTTFIFIKLYKSGNFSILIYAFISALLFLSINSGHYIRNYKLTKNILGTDKTESNLYANEKMSPKLLISNIIKNAGLHIGPYPFNRLSNRLIYKFHLIAGININNAETNFLNINYWAAPDIPNHEDSASNPIHFLLIFFTFILVGKNIVYNNNYNNRISLYIAMILMQIVIFCLYLKWQPWHSKLHTPLFLLCIPLISYAISINNKYFKLLNKSIHIIIFYALLVILFNCTRPFISNKYTTQTYITDNRYKKRFAGKYNIDINYKEYSEIIDILDKMNYKNIGLILGIDDYEYPLFSQFYSKKLNPIHIKVSNITKNIPLKQNNLDCIISTTLKDSLIEFDGKLFYNENIKNKVIWLYKSKKL